MKTMSWMLLSAALCAGAVTVAVAQNADPYASNAAAGALQFPLAAKAGQDSGAARAAPTGAVNTGRITVDSWKFGPASDVPGGVKIWNPVKQKMIEGGTAKAASSFRQTEALLSPAEA